MAGENPRALTALLYMESIKLDLTGSHVWTLLLQVLLYYHKTIVALQIHILIRLEKIVGN
jgi:hypothetical protein